MRARLLVLRRLLRLRDIRGRDRSLLGTIARARKPEPGQRAPAGLRNPGARPGRHRGRLGIRVRARRSERRPRPGRAHQHPGLVPEVRTADGPWRRRGRYRRRHGAAVPGRRRSGQTAARGTHAGPRTRRRPGRQPRNRRLRGRDGRSRIHGACQRLRGQRRRPRSHTFAGVGVRYAAASRRRCGSPARPGVAPRRRGTRW